MTFASGKAEGTQAAAESRPYARSNLQLVEEKTGQDSVLESTLAAPIQ